MTNRYHICKLKLLRKDVGIMLVRELLRTAIDSRGMSQTRLSEKMNINNKALWNNLHQENPTLNVVLRLLDALDYEVVVRPKRGTQNTGSYILEGEAK